MKEIIVYKLNEDQKKIFDDTFQKSNGMVGWDQYGAGIHEKLYIEEIKDDYSTLVTSSGREFYLDYISDDLEEMFWYPKPLLGDHDEIILAPWGGDNYDEYEFMHGS